MTQRVRRRHRRSGGSVGKKLLVVFVLLLVAIGGGVAGAALWAKGIADAVSTDDPTIKQGESSVVFAADGTRLGYIRSDEVRETVSMGEIPRSLREATVAIEDKNFYEHDGVDFMAVVRAAMENIEAGEIREGASTITQQLARNLYIAEPEDTLERKIEEASLASQLEDDHSKRWILQRYLNTASYGTNSGQTAIGVEAASQVYFSKHVSELDLDEAALLAGLPQAPSEYNPFTNPEEATDRRNAVLEAMNEEGYISDAEYLKTARDGLGLERGYRYETIREPYFFEYVQQTLIDRYDTNPVRQGGLEVHTTIDPQLQDLAQQAVDSQAAALGGPSVALVSTDVDTGQIVAMASSGDFATRQYNLAAQGHRQPGSAFKPFALATAIKQGVDPDATYYSGASPVTLSIDDYSTWTVNNSGEAGAGTLSLTQATTNSTNVVYAQLALDIGPENIAETANDLGIETELDGLPAETIGGLTIGVSPLEMSNAFGSFASGGVHHPATAIAEVEFKDGETDVLERPEGERVLTEGEAYTITEILKTVITSGTATAANIGCPAAGKTGTTDEQTDAWFVGYTPELSTAVWVGHPDARISMGSSAFGGTYAAPAWQEYMSAAIGSSCDDFDVPASLPSLTPLYSGHTVEADYGEEEEPSSDGGYVPDDSTDDTDVPEDTEPDSGDTNGYDPDLYAPGAGQDPLPSPDDGGGDTGGGGGTGGTDG